MINNNIVICFRNDGSSNSGIAYVVQVISHLLHPNISEYASVFVGKLIIILVKKVSLTSHH